MLRRVGLWPALIGLLNGTWIVLWHYEVFPATVVVMVALLLSLIALYRRAGFDRLARIGSGITTSERWLVQIPFSLYLGWITVATIANIAAVGEWAGVPTFGIPEPLIAAVVLLAGLAIAITVMLRTADIAYGAVIVWAYIGIVVRERETDWVPWVAGVGALVIATLILGALVRRPPNKLQPAT
jgi:hypothetical protein